MPLGAVLIPVLKNGYWLKDLTPSSPRPWIRWLLDGADEQQQPAPRRRSLARRNLAPGKFSRDNALITMTSSQRGG